MNTNKTSTHGKIVGSWGEQYIRMYFSKLGYTILDQVEGAEGADMFVIDPKTNISYGLSVEARDTRSDGKTNGGENKYLNTSNKKIETLIKSCKNVLISIPCMSFVIDKKDGRQLLFVMKLDHYLKICPDGPKKIDRCFKLTDAGLEEYKKDPEISYHEMILSDFRCNF